MKNQRHQDILNIISQGSVGTQDELLQKLKEAGYIVTQATVSRDIKQLGLVKSQVAGQYRYARPENPKSNYVAMLSNSIVSIDYALNDVVVKCYPGTASAAAAAIDGMELDGVVGTVSGDDTILIIARNESKAKSLSDFLKSRI